MLDYSFGRAVVWWFGGARNEKKKKKRQGRRKGYSDALLVATYSAVDEGPSYTTRTMLVQEQELNHLLLVYPLDLCLLDHLNPLSLSWLVAIMKGWDG